MARRVINNADVSSNAVASVMRQADSFKKERERIENLSEEEQKNLSRDIPVDDLVPFPENEDVFGMDNEQITLTAAMIKEHGFWGAIWVTPYRDGKYMIISGHQRWKAAIAAGQKTIPAFVYEIDQETAYRMWIDSNQLQRKATPYAKFKLIQSARKHIEEREKAGDPHYININVYDKLVELTHIPKAGISRYESIGKLPQNARNYCQLDGFPYTLILPAAKFGEEKKEAFDEALHSYMNQCGYDPNPEEIRNLVNRFAAEPGRHARDTYANLPDNEKIQYEDAKEKLSKEYHDYAKGKEHSDSSLDTDLKDLAIHLNFLLDGDLIRIDDPKEVTASIDMLTKCIRKLRTRDGVY